MPLISEGCSQSILCLPMHSLGELPFLAAERSPNPQAVLYQLPDGTWTDMSWTKLLENIYELAAGLRTLGVKRGDHVVVRGDTSVQWLLLDMACFHVGAINIPIPLETESVVSLELTQLTQARMTICLGEDTREAELAYVDIPRDCRAAQAMGPSYHETATIMFTSGSTGQPKGVIRSHRSLIRNIRHFNDIGSIKAGDIFYLFLSVNHIAGRQGLYRYLAHGITLAIPNKLDTEFDCEGFRFIRPSHSLFVPRCLDKLVRLYQPGKQGSIQDFLGGRLRYVSYGGGVTQETTMRVIKDDPIAFVQGYGCTEASVIAVQAPTQSKLRQGCGQVLKHYAIEISEDSEILVKGPDLFDGYLTKDGRLSAKDADGFYHTGDYGYLDEEGNLHVDGRRDGSFASRSGNRIYPAHLEHLLENIKGVAGAIIIGDKKPYLSVLIESEEGASLQSIHESIAEINQSLRSDEQMERFVILNGKIPSSIRHRAKVGKIFVKRDLVLEYYAEQIQQLYATEDQP